MTDTTAEIQFFLKAIAGEARMQILILLGTHGDLSVGEVADHMDMSMSTISGHLKELRRGQLVTYRKEGRHVYYRLDRSAIAHNLDALKELLACC